MGKYADIVILNDDLSVESGEYIDIKTEKTRFVHFKAFFLSPSPKNIKIEC